jgi:hypothetical protein
MQMKNAASVSEVSPVWTKEMRFDEKHIAIFCAKGVMIALDRNPGLDKVRFWPDPDSTSIEWFFGKRAAGNVMGGFVDRGDHLEPMPINVMPIVGRKPHLLEVADCIAYVTQKRKANNFTRNGERFRALYKMIAPQEVEFTTDREGNFGYRVPNSIGEK